VLPLPRRRVDPEVLRDRLRALAEGGPGTVAVQGLAAIGLTADQGDATAPPEDDEPGGLDGDEPPAAARASLRAVIVAVAATALAAWGVVHLTSGGTPSALELVPGTPVPSVSGVVPGPSGSSSPGPTSGASASASASPGASTADVVVVQVIGQVRRPGLVSLPLGSRVADAIAAAGGLARGGSSGGLNLARVLTDGEQVVVSPDVVATPGPVSSVGGAAPTVVDLNTATLSDLDTLPGVGPVMAGRILDWRTAHGRFTSVDQLREVSGIGARTFERLKPHVRV
jgi:competence protein ComEA